VKAGLRVRHGSRVQRHQVGDVIEAFVVERVARPCGSPQGAEIQGIPDPIRVGEQIRVELTELIARSARSRVGLHADEVKVSPDLQLARVYYTSSAITRRKRARRR